MLSLVLIILGLACLLGAAFGFTNPRIQSIQLIAAGVFLVALAWFVRSYNL